MIDYVVRAVRSTKFYASSEEELQDALVKVFTEHSLPFAREQALGSAGRVDFMVGRLAVEVKTAGSMMEVTRQVQRYASSDRVDAVLVVTTKARHASIPVTLNGKPIHVTIASAL